MFLSDSKEALAHYIDNGPALGAVLPILSHGFCPACVEDIRLLQTKKPVVCRISAGFAVTSPDHIDESLALFRRTSQGRCNNQMDGVTSPSMKYRRFASPSRCASGRGAGTLGVGIDC